jgi:hypothetical protein
VSAPPDPTPEAGVEVSWQASAESAARDQAPRDGHFDPGFIEGSIRRLMHAWRSAGDGDPGALSSMATKAVVAEAVDPHAQERTTRVALRDVRWREITIKAVYPNSVLPTAEPQLSVFIHAQAADDRPPPVVSGYVPRPLDFTIFWTLEPGEPDDGGWRLSRAHATTRDGLDTTPYVLRRETVAEYRDRCGIPDGALVTPTPRSGPPYRYRISCDYADHDLRIGGSATTTIEADAAPTRAEAEQLTTPVVLDDVRLRTKEHEVQPSVQTIGSSELLSDR